MIPVHEEHALRVFQRLQADLGATMLHDQTLPGTKYRPDFLFLSPVQRSAVVVECDERQHATYCPKKERSREAIILSRLRELGYAPTIVRYDPEPRAERRSSTRLGLVCQMIRQSLCMQPIDNLVWRSDVDAHSVRDGYKVVVYDPPVKELYGRERWNRRKRQKSPAPPLA